MTIARAACLLLILLSSAVQAQDCYDYRSDYPESSDLIGTMCLLGDARACQIDGDTAYLLSATGLHVYDITDPASPVELAALATPGEGWDLALYQQGANHYALIADGDAGLQVVDVTIPASPGLVSEFRFLPAYGIDVQDDMAAVAHKEDGVSLIDLSIIDDLDVFNTTDTPGSGRNVAFADTLICVADGSSGLQIIQIKFGEPMPIIGNYDGGSAMDVAVIGSHAMVIDRNNGAQLMDLSTPTAPVLADALNFGTYGQNVEAGTSDIFWVTRSLGGGGGVLYAIDCSTPTDIVSPGNATLAWTPFRAAVNQATNTAMVACGSEGFVTVDVSAHPYPVLHSEVALDYMTSLYVDGNYAYVAAAASGILVIDVSDAAHPFLATTYDTPGYANDVLVEGGYAYVADSGTGIIVLDVSDPTSPSQVDLATYGSNYFQELAKQGDWLYATAGDDGLVSFFAGNPAEPNFANAAPAEDYSYFLCVEGDYAYVIDDEYSLIIYDVSVPQAMYRRGNIVGTIGEPQSIDYGNGYVWLVDTDDNLLRSIDVSDPDAPVEFGSVMMPGYPRAVDCVDLYAYVAVDDLGLHVVDISTPLAPAIIGWADAPGAAYDVVNRMHEVFLLDLWGGTQIAWRDCDDLTPVFLSRFDISALPGEVRIAWETEAGGGDAEFRLTGSADGEAWTIPYAEALPGSYAATDRSAHVAAGGRLNYALHYREPGTDWQPLRSEQVVVEATPRATRIAGAWPNPFNPKVTIGFELAAAGEARLAVYDLSGRKVAVLVEGRLAAGEHAADWDGRDEAGRELASGVYLARLSAVGGGATQRLVLVR